jgi:RNA polymerase sigma-70 factor (ECF subfamily)
MEAVLKQSPQASDETHLADRFRSGEQAAFEEVMTRHRRTVYAVARRLLRNHEDADEAAQVAFVKAWKGRERFLGNARLKTWLVRIAMNVAKSMLAARRETRELVDEPGPAGMSIDPGARLDGLRLRQELRLAVGTLPPRQQEVVMLKVYEDLTYREVAEILELSDGAVKAHLHQAVSNLRRGMRPKKAERRERA